MVRSEGSGDVNDEHPCIDCGEDTLNDERCRDCNLEWLFTYNQCSVCKRKRFSDGAMTGLPNVTALEIWGPPCACKPKPPTVYESTKTRAE